MNEAYYTGKLLISTPALEGSIFEKTVVFITEHNEKGATGFIINKIFHRRFNELVEFRHSAPFPMYHGGPVDTEGLFFLHRQPELITEGKHIIDTIYFGGNFKLAVTGINNKSIQRGNIKLLVGYCGWDAEQLQAEITESSWQVANATPDIVLMAGGNCINSNYKN
jgi:putative transcriptional regulator